MKKLILILFLLPCFRGFSTSIVIGSGSGAITQTSQSTLSPGDTIYVVAGTYASSGTISNISGAPGKNIIVIPQSGPFTVINTGGINFLNDKYMIVEYFDNGNHAFAWQMNGDNGNTGGKTNVSNVTFAHMHFFNISGAAFKNYNNIVYNYTTHDTTTLACYKCKFDSLTLDTCGAVYRGSFGTVGDSIDVCLNDTFSRILVRNFASNGNGFAGIQLRSLLAYITVRQTTYEAYAADQGLFTFGGGGGGFSGTIHDIYIDGPVATWIARLNAYSLNGSSTDSILVYNIQATNKSTFGGVVIQSLSGDLLSGRVASCNAAVFNVSTGNCPTQNTFWNYTVDIGSGMHSQTVHIKNCIGFNNAFTGKTPGVIIDESSGNPPTYDSSNNTYAASATLLALDSSGTWPTYAPLQGSIVFGAGTSTPYSTGLDLSGQRWAAPPSEGPYMSNASTTALSFTQLGTTPDVIANDRGAEGWNGRTWDNGVGGAIKVPIGNVQRKNDYYRFLWRTDIAEVTQGTYSFTTFDAQINKAIDSGRTFSFGIMPMCDACGVNPSYPDYLHTLMQAEATNSKDWTNSNGDWVPNWNSPNYLARYKALLVAVAAHIASGTHGGKNYKDVIGYVDVRGYGDFGEWQTYPWTGTEPTGRTATAASLDSLVDFNRQAFPNFWNVNLQGVFDPSNSSQMPTAVTNYALAEKNNIGLFGWRRDQWGDKGDSVILDKNPHGSPITDSIMNRYKEAPIVGEPQLSSNTFNCGSILCDLPREVTFYHATSFGNGNYANDGDAGTQANVISASANSGYRLVIDSGRITTNIYRNFPLTISLYWQNLGVTPVYYTYNVTYILKNAGGTTIWTGNSSFNPRLFLPSGSPTGVTDIVRMGNVAPGSGYNLYVQLSDPVGYKAPLQLAITGRQSDGSYLLQSGITILNRNMLIIQLGESNSAGNAGNSKAFSWELGVRDSVQILNHSNGQFANLKIGTGGNNQQGTFFTDSTHGMELAMADQVDSGHLPNPTYTVKIGISGQVICQDFAGGCIKVGDMSNFDAWDNYMPYVDSAMSKMTALGVPYDVYIWGSLGLNNRFNQGTPAAHFYDSMLLYEANIRTRIGRSDAQFYWTNFNNPPSITYDWKYLFDSLAKVDPLVHSIPVLGATYVDGGTHYDYAGFKLIVSNIIDTMQGFSPQISLSASAGANQNFNTLVTSATLNGSASSGSISTYLWTQLSGPNTATITSPGSGITTITGLVSGAYVFQLSLNGGAAVATTTVTILNQVRLHRAFKTIFQ